MFQGINGAVRDETLLQLKVPTMFVQVVFFFQFLSVLYSILLSPNASLFCVHGAGQQGWSLST